jgi:hypothetical protein
MRWVAMMRNALSLHIGSILGPGGCDVRDRALGAGSLMPWLDRLVSAVEGDCGVHQEDGGRVGLDGN